MESKEINCLEYEYVHGYEPHAHVHAHVHDHSHDHSHSHSHGHGHAHALDHSYDHGRAHNLIMHALAHAHAHPHALDLFHAHANAHDHSYDHAHDLLIHTSAYALLMLFSCSRSCACFMPCAWSMHFFHARTHSPLCFCHGSALLCSVLFCSDCDEFGSQVNIIV